MRLLAQPHQLPVRFATGAFILNSGLSMSGADEKTAAGLHGMARQAYPMLDDVHPAAFTRLLSKAEIAIGVALLVPVVPTVVAGAALTGFAAGLVGLYLRVPGMRRERDLRPSEEGLVLAKDVWLLGIGLSLVTEELSGCRRTPGRR